LIYSQNIWLSRAPNWDLTISVLKPSCITVRGSYRNIDNTEEWDDREYLPFTKNTHRGQHHRRLFIRRKYFTDLEPGSYRKAVLFITSGDKQFSKLLDFENRLYRGVRSLHFPSYIIGYDDIKIRSSYGWGYKATSQNMEPDVYIHRFLCVSDETNLFKERGELDKQRYEMKCYPTGIERKGLPLRVGSYNPTYKIRLSEELMPLGSVPEKQIIPVLFSIMYYDDICEFCEKIGAHGDIAITEKSCKIKKD